MLSKNIFLSTGCARVHPDRQWTYHKASWEENTIASSCIRDGRRHFNYAIVSFNYKNSRKQLL